MQQAAAPRPDAVSSEPSGLFAEAAAPVPEPHPEVDPCAGFEELSTALSSVQLLAAGTTTAFTAVVQRSADSFGFAPGAEVPELNGVLDDDVAIAADNSGGESAHLQLPGVTLYDDGMGTTGLIL